MKKLKTKILLWLLVLSAWGAASADDKESKGISLYREGRYQEAIAALAEELQGACDERCKAISYAYLALCYEELGNSTTAETMWETVCRDYPNSIHAPDGNYFLACQAKARGDQKKWEQCLEKAATFFKSSRTAGRASWELGDYYRAKGNGVQAWKWYSYAIRSPFSKEEKLRIKGILDPLVEELLLYQKVPASTTYEVKARDTLQVVARKFNTTPGMILWINQKESPLLVEGENLKIVTMPLWVEVSKESFFLGVFFENGYYVRGYEIAGGEEVTTGNYFVGTKVKYPEWHDESRVVPYGHPDNPLGTRWIGFRSEILAIHGTNEPGCIGQKVSGSSICLRNKDVEFLFELLIEDTEVVVK